jgi:hypothetical protein
MQNGVKSRTLTSDQAPLVRAQPMGPAHLGISIPKGNGVDGSEVRFGTPGHLLEAIVEGIPDDPSGDEHSLLPGRRFGAADLPRGVVGVAGFHLQITHGVFVRRVAGGKRRLLRSASWSRGQPGTRV